MINEDFINYSIHFVGILIVVAIFYGLRYHIRLISFHFFFSLLWLALLIGSQVVDIKFRLQPFTLCFFYFALILFLLGVFTYAKIARTKIQTFSVTNYYVYSPKILKIILLCLLIANIFVVYSLFSELFKNGLSINNFSSLRSTENQEYLHQSRPLYQIFGRSYLIYIPLGIYLLSIKRISKTYLSFVVITALTFSASNFTRAPVLQLFITIFISLTILYEKRLSKILPRLILFAAFVILAFSIMQMQILDNSESNSYNVGSATALYFFGGAKAFEDILYGKYPKDISGYYSFDSINYILERLGIIREYPSLLRDYSQGEVFTNVYTYLDANTLDFGITGAFLGCFLIGILSMHVYKFTIKYRSIFWIVVYSYFVYSLTISFLNNEFIRINTIIIVAQALIVDTVSRVRRARLYANRA